MRYSLESNAELALTMKKRGEVKNKYTVIENLFLKLIVKIMIEIKTLFWRIGTAMIEVVRNARNM